MNIQLIPDNKYKNSLVCRWYTVFFISSIEMDSRKRKKSITIWPQKLILTYSTHLRYEKSIVESATLESSKLLSEVSGNTTQVNWYSVVQYE